MKKTFPVNIVLDVWIKPRLRLLLILLLTTPLSLRAQCFSPITCGVGDVKGDNRLGIVTANVNSNNVTVLLAHIVQMAGIRPDRSSTN